MYNKHLSDYRMKYKTAETKDVKPVNYLDEFFDS